MTSGVTRFLALTAMLAVAAGCTNQQLQGTSSSYLIIDSLQGASGAKPSELGETLSSDVHTMVKVTIDGKETQVPTIFADNGSVKFTLALKDPGGSGDNADEAVDHELRHGHALSGQLHPHRRPQHAGRGRALRVRRRDDGDGQRHRRERARSRSCASRPSRKRRSRRSPTAAAPSRFRRSRKSRSTAPTRPAVRSTSPAESA